MQNQTRVTLQTGYLNGKEVVRDIESLTEEFKTANKRNSDVELFLSESGSLKKSIFELTAYYDSKDQRAIKDLEYIKESLQSLNDHKQ